MHWELLFHPSNLLYPCVDEIVIQGEFAQDPGCPVCPWEVRAAAWHLPHLPCASFASLAPRNPNAPLLPYYLPADVATASLLLQPF